MSKEERDEGNRKLMALFIGIVTVSAGLVALQFDATPAQIGLSLAGGFLVGLALLWYLVRTFREFGTANDRGR